MTTTAEREVHLAHRRRAGQTRVAAEAPDAGDSLVARQRPRTATRARVLGQAHTVPAPMDQASLWEKRFAAHFTRQT
jgi:hypothetical protein